jgi:hypothetical protein
MAQDRYLKGVLTIIAAALVYLCLVLTPWPGAVAQGPPPLVRPGDYTGPIPVAVVSWRAAEGVAAVVQNTVQVAGRVATERGTGEADRVVLVGWEERSDPVRGNKEFRPFDVSGARGLPTQSMPR